MRIRQSSVLKKTTQTTLKENPKRKTKTKPNQQPPQANKHPPPHTPQKKQNQNKTLQHFLNSPKPNT